MTSEARSITVAGVAALALVAWSPTRMEAQAGAAVPARAAVAPTSAVTGDAASGKKLYYEHACYSCHGYNGETGARPFVPNWPANLATERSFTAFLRGRANLAPVQPSTAMPNYSAQSLPDGQARDIYAYIRSFKSSTVPIEKIPTMNAILAAAQKRRTSTGP